MPAQGGQRAGQGEYVTSARQPESSASLAATPCRRRRQLPHENMSKTPFISMIYIASSLFLRTSRLLQPRINTPQRYPHKQKVVCHANGKIHASLRLRQFPPNILKHSETDGTRLGGAGGVVSPAVVAIILSILSTSHFISSNSSRASGTLKSAPSSTLSILLYVSFDGAKDRR